MSRIRTAIHPAAWIPRWTNETARVALERASRFGFDHVVVTLRRFDDIDPPAIAKAFSEFAMTPVNAAGCAPDADVSSLDAGVRARGLERLRHALRLARDMGSSHVGGVLYSALRKYEHAATAEHWRHAADGVAIIGEEARRMGIRLALEIVNRYESNLINTVAQALDFLAAVDCDNVWLHLDTFHMNIEEADLRAALAAALPRLVYFELDQNHRGLLRPGLVDFAPLLADLAASGFAGIVGVETFSRYNLAADHADALAIWRNTFEDGDAVALQSRDLIREAFGRP
jgi:D-psicose/D-tagatose/L-ribulose 3-epimerase